MALCVQSGRTDAPSTQTHMPDSLSRLEQGFWVEGAQSDLLDHNYPLQKRDGRVRQAWGSKDLSQHIPMVELSTILDNQVGWGSSVT